MRKNKDIVIDDLYAHKENDKIIVKAWVFEDDVWGYRELTETEVEKALALWRKEIKGS